MGDGLVVSAHDCSDGGFAVALAEACFGAGAGCNIDVSQMYADCKEINNWGVLFGESLGRITVSVKPEKSTAFESAMAGHTCYRLGEVGRDDDIRISNGSETILTASMMELKKSWQSTLNGGDV
jgi:phosphoribosylformylglycinamidine synthase